MIQKISKLSCYAFLVMVPMGGLFVHYLSRNFGGYQITVFDFILWVAFATFAMDFCVNKRPFLPHAMDKWMLFLFGTCMFFFFFGLYNRNAHVLVWGLRSTWAVFLLYFPLAHYIGFDKERREGLVKFILIYSAVIGLLAIPLRLGLFASIVDPIWQAGPLSEFAGTTRRYDASYRIAWVCRSTYVDFALGFCLAILLLGSGLLKLVGNKIGWLVVVIANNIAILLISKGRGALFMSACALALCGSLIWLNSRARLQTSVRLAVFVIIGIVVIMVFVYFMEDDMLCFIERLSGVSLKDRTIHMRILTAEKDIESFLESPILGKGLGFSDWFYYRGDAAWRRTYGEVGITRMLTWFGLLGTGIIYSFLVWLLIRALRLLKHADLPLDKAIGAVCAALIAGMMATGLVFVEHAVVLILVAVLLRGTQAGHKPQEEPAGKASISSEFGA
jgi:hypothetical protein